MLPNWNELEQNAVGLDYNRDDLDIFAFSLIHGRGNGQCQCVSFI